MRTSKPLCSRHIFVYWTSLIVVVYSQSLMLRDPMISRLLAVRAAGSRIVSASTQFFRVEGTNRWANNQAPVIVTQKGEIYALRVSIKSQVCK